jgi:acetylglutamate kinase
MIRVVKIGGRVQNDPRLPIALASAARVRSAEAAPAASLCVVHGGGDEVSALQRRLQMEPAFVGGRRVTTADDLEVVRMVLSGTINKRLVSQLLQHGVRAVGISGEDGMLLTAQVIDAARMGRVGRVVSVDAGIVHHLLECGYVPVVSPLARDAAVESGTGGLNVNGDDAAAALAAALRADELLFVADVAGVLEHGALLATIDLDRVPALIANGVAAGGMAAKLESAAQALHGGVAAVRIAGLEGIADPEAGTRIVHSHSSV